MLSLPLTSSLYIYISDKPKSKALLTLSSTEAPHLTPERQANRKVGGQREELTQGSDK